MMISLVREDEPRTLRSSSGATETPTQSGTAAFDVTRDSAYFRGASRVMSLVGCAPEERWTSDSIQAELDRAGLKQGFDLELKSGVKERRVARHRDVVELALPAARAAIERAGIEPRAIDLVLFCGVCRQYSEPATAAVLHGMLGLQAATAFDISDACLGFIDGWMVADALIACGRARCALVVSAEFGTYYGALALEALKRGEDPQQHFASLTLGDGAAAAVLGAKTASGGGVVMGLRETHGQYYPMCIIPSRDEPMRSNPVQLMKLGLKSFAKHARRLVEASGWTVDELDLVVPHQASGAVIEHGRRHFGVTPDKVATTVDRFGNQASVAVPFALAEAMEQGRVGSGSKVLLAGFGSGLGIGMLTLTL
jgi:3-oxoacyl-[acyl-carrier-protein] synthase III